MARKQHEPKTGEASQRSLKQHEEQDEWGNSIAILQGKLRLSPMERLLSADASQRSLWELLHAARRAN